MAVMMNDSFKFNSIPHKSHISHPKQNILRQIRHVHVRHETLKLPEEHTENTLKETSISKDFFLKRMPEAAYLTELTNA